eukprot:TRINITY_DN2202_c5_g1_i1.p1 TRINITY_DN2202_c5_g1~~TRINITY_DN2202_c5_g1_i1.p1  ORF type:complete len:330 (+),score=111.18 TRINITY_DN2202_c5_g1_i1:31-990(+)
MTEDVEYKAVPLQQGVSVRIVPADQIREAWARFKRDDYEDEMLKVAGKVGTILHQHPSGAFTVLFEGKVSGLKKNERLRLKFPPKALVSCDMMPVKKRKPRLPKHVKTKRSPASPVASTPSALVEPEIVNDPPPASTAEQKRIDECLFPSPSREKSIEAERMIAICEEEESYTKEEEAQAKAEEPEEDEEAAFLENLAEEEAAAAAEEEAFLEDLEDDSSAAPSPPPSSAGSPQKENVISVQVIEPPKDDGPRVQVIYEPHDSVTENAKRFGGAALRSKHSNIDHNIIQHDKAYCNASPRRQVVTEDPMKVNDLRARFE